VHEELTAMPIELQTRKGRPPRVVIDNHLVITALMFGGGTAARLRQAWQNGHCRPMVCKATVLDLLRQLGQPQLGFSAQEQQSLLGEFMPHVLKVRVPEADSSSATTDPAGLALVRLAMAGKAHALVTADRDLLAMTERFICPVLTLDSFIDTLASRRDAARPPSRTALAA
jgi:predicted nucleic acid-binding protein